MEIYDFDFSDIIDKYSPDEVTIEDIINEIKNVSLDMVSGDNTLSSFADGAPTYLYSGAVSGNVGAGKVATALEDVRILDKTKAAYLLGNDKFNELIINAFENDIVSGRFTMDSIDLIAKGLNEKELKSIIDILNQEEISRLDASSVSKIASKGFMYEPTEGAWAIISERFVEATPENSVIKCYTNNANLERTWAQVEVVTILDKLPDEQVVGNTTVGELKALKNQGGMDAVYEKMMSDSLDVTSNTILHMDGDGKIIGASNSDVKYTGESVFDVKVSELDDVTVYIDGNGKIIDISSDISEYKNSSAFTTSVDDFINYDTDKNLINRYEDYASLNDLEKIEAKQLDLSLSKIDRILGDFEVPSSTVELYLSAAGKSVDNLDAVDKVLLKLADKTPSQLQEISKTIGNLGKKCSAISETAKEALPVVNTVFTVIEVADTLSTAAQYYYEGDYGRAAQTIANKALIEATGFTITTAISPYLMGFGAATAMSGGVVIGAVVAGYVGYEAAEVIVESASEFGYSLGGWLYDLFHGASEARVVNRDPLILDIAGDGFNVLSKSEGTYFDLNCDGFAEKINWTSKDGLLSYDIDGNGKIDNGREVFGDYHLLADGTRAKNGFEALIQYDTNGDGIIDKNDEIFSKLCLWIDTSSDGISDSGELKTLEELNIVAIKLNYEEVNRTTGTEALIGNVATFVYADNTEGEIGEMWVSSDLYDTVETFMADVSESVEGLPNVRSYGTVSSLHNAMALDETGELQSLVESFVSEEDMSTRMGIVEDILWFICDANSVSQYSRGSFIDARKLKVIESFMGQDFMGVNGANPNSAAAPILNNAYNEIIEMYCYSMIGSRISNVVNYISVTDNGNGNVSYDATLFSFMLNVGIESGKISERDFKDAIAYVGYVSSNIQNNYSVLYQTREYFKRYAPQYLELVESSLYGAIYGDENENSLSGTTADDIIITKNGNDYISGGAGNDLLIAGNGNDEIFGGSGNDLLEGGSGNDILSGGYGADTYVFNLGDGEDVINNYDSGSWKNDKIVLGEGITPEDIELTREGYNLIIRNVKSEDKITIQDAYKDSDGWYYIGSIEFADGTIWGQAELRANRKMMRGTDGDDKLTGFDSGYNNNTNEIFEAGAGNDIVNGGTGNDVIYGGAGNDTISAGSGADVLEGGRGNDILSGGYGADTYVFNLGDGDDVINNYDSGSWKNDKIVLGEGIAPEDIELTREGYNLIIRNVKSEDKITVQNAYKDSDGWYYIGSIEFSDGTVWGLSELRAKMKTTLRGTEGADTLTGYDSGYNNNTNEVFEAGAGDDVVNAGYGNDVIYAGSGNDTVNAGDGNDIIYSGSGKDIINAGNGEDYIEGGAGNDILSGGYGADTYVFNLGDGEDVINNYDSGSWKNDKIVLGEGITPEDIELTREGYNLIIRNVKSEDKITIQDAYKDSDGWYYIGSIEFADGTIWGQAELRANRKMMRGTDGDDKLTGFDSGYNNNTNEIFEAGAGNDIVNGGTGNDVIYGGAGNDTISEGSGADVLEGGRGNDILSGGYGADTYVFNLGDGDDVINNYDSGSWKNDKIVLGEGIAPEDIELTREGYNLIIRNVKSEDKITVQNAYKDSDGWYYIGSIEFSDGTVWGLSELRAKMKTTLRGTEGADTLTGYDSGYNNNTNEVFEAGAGDDVVNAGYGNDVIYAGSGNDTVNAGDGNDIIYSGSGKDIINAGNGEDYIEGGAGNDILSGGYGADTYVFNLGDGEDVINNYDSGSWKNDKIVLGEGIAPEDIELTREGYNLIIRNVKSEDKITVQDAYKDSDGWYYIGSIEFADGTIWGQAELRANRKMMRGTDGDDKLTGFDSGYNNNTNEIFEAGAGNDIVNGGTGNDVIYGGAGNDTISAGSGADVLEGGRGNDILSGGYGADTYVFNLGDGDDVINNYDSGSWKNDKIVLGEGIAPEDIELTREGYNLIIRNVKSEDKITVQNAYKDSDGWYYIGSIEFSDGTVWGLSELRAKMKTTLRGTEGADTLTGYDSGYNNNTNEVFEAGAGDDVVNAGYGNDVIYAGSGNDTVNAGDGNDIIYSGSGKDIINAGNGEDYIEGGAGNDILSGGYGADTYVFNLGDGEDVINNYDSGSWKNDKIVLGEGIAPEDIELTREGYNLIIRNVKSEDKITVQDAYKDSDGWYYIGSIEFADGTIWGQAELRANRKMMRGTDGDDKLTGFDSGYNNNTNEIFEAGAGNDIVNGGTGNDVIYGGAGNDTINAGSGADVLEGGSGNDILSGGYGADTYVFNLGDGEDVINNYDSGNWKNDKIVFGEGIKAEDIELTREGYNLIIRNVKSEDKITVQDAYKDSDGWYYIGSIEFADGTIWGQAELRANRKMMRGTDGDDKLTGFDSGYNNNTNEIFDGGAGNDILNGGYGNDTYIFYTGCGNDTIYDYSGTNKIQFTDDIRPEDITVSRVGTYNVVLIISGCEDTITIQNFMYSTYYRNFTLSFADGRTATFDITNICLIYEPAEEPVADLDTLSQENAQSLADLMSEGDVTSNTQTTTTQNDLSAIMLEDNNVDASTDTQAGLLAQELSASTTDNNVFTTDDTTNVEKSQLFTEQCTVA